MTSSVPWNRDPLFVTRVPSDKISVPESSDLTSMIKSFNDQSTKFLAAMVKLIGQCKAGQILLNKLKTAKNTDKNNTDVNNSDVNNSVELTGKALFFNRSNYSLTVKISDVFDDLIRLIPKTRKLLKWNYNFVKPSNLENETNKLVNAPERMREREWRNFLARSDNMGSKGKEWYNDENANELANSLLVLGDNIKERLDDGKKTNKDDIHAVQVVEVLISKYMQLRRDMNQDLNKCGFPQERLEAIHYSASAQCGMPFHEKTNEFIKEMDQWSQIYMNNLTDSNGDSVVPEFAARKTIDNIFGRQVVDPKKHEKYLTRLAINFENWHNIIKYDFDKINLAQKLWQEYTNIVSK